MSIHDLPVNKNGRIYPPDVLRKAIADAQPRIEAGRMIGQLENPADGKTRLSEASHIVRKMRVNAKGEIIGTLEFVDTPVGKAVFEMVKQGGLVAGTLRGTGTVENGVVSDMTLGSVDVTMAAPEFEIPSAVDKLADIVREETHDADR